MAKIAVGEIRHVNGSAQLALVIFVGEDGMDRLGDVRVVPLYRGMSHAATHRDLVIPADANSLNDTLLAACWNARGLAGGDLLERVGDVRDRVVEAARHAEMAGIIPGLAMARYADLLGLRPTGEEAIQRAKRFQLAEAKRWDILEQQLAAFRESWPAFIFEREVYRTERPAQAVVTETTVDLAPEANLGGWKQLVQTWNPEQPRAAEPALHIPFAEAA